MSLVQVFKGAFHLTKKCFETVYFMWQIEHFLLVGSHDPSVGWMESALDYAVRFDSGSTKLGLSKMVEHYSMFAVFPIFQIFIFRKCLFLLLPNPAFQRVFMEEKAPKIRWYHPSDPDSHRWLYVTMGRLPHLVSRQVIENVLICRDWWRAIKELCAKTCIEVH